jgi:galactose-1-phosphate uridylyltransferase
VSRDVLDNTSILRQLIESVSIADLSTDQLVASLMEEKPQGTYTPAMRWQIDPRNGEPILHNSARALRPYDRPARGGAPSMRVADCPICSGNTTGILDWHELSEGFTFVNRNLYPALRIVGRENPTAASRQVGPEDLPAWGIHLLQWTSTCHDRDWHNMPFDDCVVVIGRLAAVEKSLCAVGACLSREVEAGEHASTSPWSVCIIKNVGRGVGGSLEHGHQQILLANQMPCRSRNNAEFINQRGETFADFLLSGNPFDLTIRDYGPAKLLVPYFMRRPYDMILVMKDTRKSHLHELSQAELKSVASGWMDGTRAITRIMPQLGVATAYNIVAHNAAGAGLYFEFLPHTQGDGGLERLGMSICQEDPYQCARRIRSVLNLPD